MRVRVLVGVMAILLLSASVALAAHNHQRGAKATIKIKGTYRNGSTKEVGATGTLSTSQDCTPSRKVTVYMKKGSKLKRLGTGKTFSTGRWEAKTGKGDDVKSGTYVAKVAAGTGRHGKKCAGDSSPPTKLP